MSEAAMQAQVVYELRKFGCRWDGCQRTAEVRGFCGGHKSMAYRHGLITPQSTEERFWAKVDKAAGGELGCWIWTGAKHPMGHGRLTAGKRNYWAHRFAYELLVGPIPEGLVLDHLCCQPSCVKPSHLEPVTQAVNAQRIADSRCRRGHDITDPRNRYERKDRPGKWNCLECRRERRREGAA